ncbi:MAG: CNP1-like family protein, partial [Burkholderiales bacterium]
MTRLVFLVAATLFATLLLHGCGGTRLAGERETDWDRNAVDAKKAEREQSVVLPPYPQDSDLVEFSVGTVPHRYFIDARTLAVGADDVVRYA